MDDQTKTNALIEAGYSPENAAIIVKCHTEGWSSRYCLGVFRVKHAVRAYRILNELCKPIKK